MIPEFQPSGKHSTLLGEAKNSRFQLTLDPTPAVDLDLDLDLDFDLVSRSKSTTETSGDFPFDPVMGFPHEVSRYANSAGSPFLKVSISGV